MSLLFESPPGPPLRKFPLVGRGALPLSMAAIVGEYESVCGDAEDEAKRLGSEDVVRKVWKVRGGWRINEALWIGRREFSR